MGRIHLQPSLRHVCTVRAWPTAMRGAAHYCAASRPTAVAVAQDRAARHACSVAATSPMWEVVGYTLGVAGYMLGVAALDSDGEMAATAVLNGVRGKWQERSTTVGVKGAAATRTFAGEEAARQAVTCAKEMGVRAAAALEKNRRHNGLPG
jgi:hypothetical protein